MPAKKFYAGIITLTLELFHNSGITTTIKINKRLKFYSLQLNSF